MCKGIYAFCGRALTPVSEQAWPDLCVEGRALLAVGGRVLRSIRTSLFNGLCISVNGLWLLIPRSEVMRAMANRNTLPFCTL